MIMGSRVRIRLMYLLCICKWEMQKTAHPKKSKCDMDLEMGDAKECSPFNMGSFW